MLVDCEYEVWGLLSSISYAQTDLSQVYMTRDLIVDQFVLKVDSFNIHDM